MTRALLAASGLALALTAAGCSALGLDRFDFPDCESGCNQLNDRDGIPVDPDTMLPTGCLGWRCDVSTGSCRYGAPDLDQDQHYSVVCAGVEGVAPADDCDDADAEIRPGSTEACNGRDDDCNGLVDDAFADAADPSVVLATTTDPGWVRAVDLEAGGVAIAYGISTDSAGFEVIESAATTVTAGDPLAPAAPTSLARDAFDETAELEPRLGCVAAAFSGREVPCDPADPTTCPASAPVCVDRPAPLGAYCEAAITFPSGYPTDGSVCHTHADCDDGSFCNGLPQCRPEGLMPAVDERRCNATELTACESTTRCDEERRGCTTYMQVACDLAHVAIAPTHEGEWFAPFVTTTAGCPDGTVRLGYFDDDPSHADAARHPQRDILQRGDTRRTTAWLGVDAHDEDGMKCTGSTRPDGAPRGASGVVAASIPPSGDRHRPEALVAFLAAPFCREHTDIACASMPTGSTGSVDVEVIGTWFEEGTAGPADAPIAWVNATGDGTPTRLSVQTTPDARRPALVEYVDEESGAAGWVLAYPRAGGGVSFHVIPAFADPSPPCEPPMPGVFRAACLEPSAAYQTRFDTRFSDATAPTDRTTAALVVPMAQHAFEDATITGDAAIALSPVSDGTARIAVAWMEADQMALATATLTIASGTIAPDATVERFPASAARELALVYVPAGLRVEDGAGFVLTWVGGDGTWGVRMLTDGTVLAPGAVRLGAPADHPRAFLEQTDRGPIVRVLGHQHSRMGFVAFPGVCGTDG